MNKKFTTRIKAILPSFLLLCIVFVLSFGQAKAVTTTFTTDSSWSVTSTNFSGWSTIGYTLNSSWVAPGGGNVNCGTVQTGVVGATKIWYPATNAFRTCYFRKSFSISQLCEVKNATIEIAAADSYVLYVNGIAIASGGATAKTVNIPVQVLQCDNVIAVQARDVDAKCWWMAAKVTINTTPTPFTASSNSSATNPICAGQALNFTSTGLAGATYAWSGPNGFTSNQQNPSIANVSLLDTGTYTVIVKIGKCCRYIATTYVQIKDCKECLDLFIKDIICKNGVYSMTICVKNNSSHTATNINLISTTSGVTYSPNILSPSGGLLPGQTYCKSVIVSGPGAFSNAKICLKAMLVEIKNCQQTWFCSSQDEVCVQLPFCMIPCNWVAAVKDSVLTICKGASTTLSAYTSPAIVGASYVWSSTPVSTIVNGNTATPTVTPLANPTVYTVTITTVNTDGTLCKKKVNVTVNLKNCPPSIPCDSVKVGFVPNSVTICLGDSVMLNPITNPLTGLTYLWIPATGLSSSSIKNPWAKPLITTTYNLIVSVPGTTCKKDASMTVIVKDCTNPTPCQWNAMVKDTSLTICRGTSTTLSAYTLPSIAGATYFWSSSPVSVIVNGATANPTVTPTVSPTIYTVTITVITPTGICKKTATVKVFLKDCPSIPCDSVKLGFSPSTINLCLGDSVQLNPFITPATGLTYLWVPATGLSSATIKNPWAKPIVTTTYNLIVSVPGTNCKKDGSITVVVKSCPPPLPCQWALMVRDSIRTICKGSSTTLSAQVSPITPGATYLWTSSISGFTATSAIATVMPTVSPTTYYITVSVPNSDGTVCIKKDSVKVTLKDCPPPCQIQVAVKDSVLRVCPNVQTTLSATSSVVGAIYSWSPSAGIMSGGTTATPIVNPSTTTTYTVTVTSPNNPNCKASATVRVEIIACRTTPTGVAPSSSRMASDTESSDEITIAPNPTQSVISVQIPDSFNWKSATLINSKGVILNELERTDNAKSAKFDVLSQPSGMYIISVKTDKGFVNKKVMKE
jgi:hypothetical protein